MSYWKKTFLSAFLFIFILGIFYFWLTEDILRYREDLSYYTIEHLKLVAQSMLIALVLGVGLGIVLSRKTLGKEAEKIIQIFNIANTIPTMAVLALALVMLGIGDGPTVLALVMASILPIIRNSYEGLKNLSPTILEAAKGIGMTPWQSLWRVELPNATPVIVAGVRTALAINVGTAPLSFLIGGDSLGGLIFPGIYLNNQEQLIIGATATAALALMIDGVVNILGYIYLAKRGLTT